MSASLDLVLFENHPQAAATALAAGIDGLIVDLEREGKSRRQEGADTEINEHHPADVARARELGARLRFCRIEGPGLWRPEEVEEVLRHGATHLFLPMVRRPEDVAGLLRQVGGRAAVGILVETAAALENVDELAALPLFGVFVGLNDLAIERRSRHLFVALADGTVERVRQAFAGRAFGFAGVTRLDAGRPLPARLLLAEMARLDASFAFLRRSFRRDVAPHEMAAEIARLREAWRCLRQRGAEEIAADQALLRASLAELEG